MMRSLQTFALYRHRSLAVLILFACLVLRAMIPSGYMPGNLLAGEFMVLCPQGLPAPTLHAMHHDHDDRQQVLFDADSSCPIGSVLLVAAPPPSAPLQNSVAVAKSSLHAAVELPRQFSPIFFYNSRAPPRSGNSKTT